MLPGNQRAVELWTRLDSLRSVSPFVGYCPLEVPAVVSLCQAFDATDEDLDKIILLERKMYPALYGKKNKGSE